MFNLNFTAKIKEAEEHIKQGEKYLKTSLTKWKPDLDSAIDEFDKACTCYRVAEKYELCRDLSLRLAELQIQKGISFFAAKSYEQAAQMTQQLQDLPTAAKYYDKAGQLYAEGGQRDSAIILYERSAPQFQQFDRAISIDFYLKAARLAEYEEKSFQAADLYEKAAMQMIRTGNYPKTTELLETVTKILTTMERYDRINRVILYRILLKLFNDDSVAGRNIFDKACQEYPTFDQWEERDHIELLLDAFDQDDKDLISQRCQKPYFLAIEPEFVRLIKLWIRPTKNKEEQTTTNPVSSGVKPIQFDDDEDDLLVGVILLISGLLTIICLLRYSYRLKKSSDDNSVKSQSCSSSQIQMILPSSAMTNNYQDKNKKISSKSRLKKYEESISNENFQKNESQHNYMNFLQLGAELIDRPFGIAVQPLNTMGSILMSFNTYEQHWIRHDEDKNGY